MAEIDKTDSSQILGLGKTPAQWVEIMAERGIEISERTLRERANENGAFYRVGFTGRRAGSSTTAGVSQAHTGEALRHLQKQAHGTG